MLTVKEFESIIKEYDTGARDGVTYSPVGKLNDGRDLCLVIGFSTGYDLDEHLVQRKEGREL